MDGFGGDCFEKELQALTNRLVVHETIMMNDLLSRLPLRVLTTMALPFELAYTPRPLFHCHGRTHNISLSLSQPWEPTLMRSVTRVTPVGVEEVMESKPYGIEVSLMVVTIPFRHGFAA